MKVRVLRARSTAALAAAMREGEPEAIRRAADEAKALGVALAGLLADDEVTPEELALSTRSAAAVLGYHPEHVRRLIRTGRLRATRVAGDYRILVDDLWPLLERGRAATQAHDADDRAMPCLALERAEPPPG